MSNTPFVESSSSDPVERAIARKVQRILNDKTLDRQRRETLVRIAQRELIEHRQRQKQQQTLTRQVATLKLPQGFRPQSITVKEDRVHVGALNRQLAFVWIDAGQAPKGMAANQSPFAPAAMASGRAARFARAWNRPSQSAARRWVSASRHRPTLDQTAADMVSAASFTIDQQRVRRSNPMSSTPFFESGDFTYTAHVHRLEVPKGSIHLGITTRWAGARDPLAENAAFNITLSEAELRKLIAALQNGLSDNA